MSSTSELVIEEMKPSPDTLSKENPKGRQHRVRVSMWSSHFQVKIKYQNKEGAASSLKRSKLYSMRSF
jgi:hypothetical protein